MVPLTNVFWYGSSLPNLGNRDSVSFFTQVGVVHLRKSEHLSKYWKQEQESLKSERLAFSMVKKKLSLALYVWYVHVLEDKNVVFRYIFEAMFPVLRSTKRHLE